MSSSRRRVLFSQRAVGSEQEPEDRFIDIKTDGGRIKGKLSLYCRVLGVTRQGFYFFLKHRDDPWKYEGIVERMQAIIAEDECNDKYGRIRMHHALELKYPD